MNFKDAIKFSNHNFAALCTLESTKDDVQKFLNKNKTFENK